MNLLANVHLGIVDPSSDPNRKIRLVRGDYQYYHYKCDGFDDVGWGCGYRTLQTLVSHMGKCSDDSSVPTIREIQQILVDLGDKDKSFLKSRGWIGSFEVCLVIDKLFEVPCKIVHCPAGVDGGSLVTGVFSQLEEHFEKFGSPVMMGGDHDASSKGILGTCASTDKEDCFLLVLDPHYCRGNGPHSASELQRKGYVKWIAVNEFDSNSFYNVCLPQFNALCTSK